MENPCACLTHPEYSGDHVWPCRLADYRPSWENGYQPSNGIVGVRGPLTNDSDHPVRVRIDVSTIPEDSLKIYRGRLQAISLLSSGDLEEGFILTVFCDLKTSSRLKESLCGMDGKPGTAGTESCRMTVTLERHST